MPQTASESSQAQLLQAWWPMAISWFFLAFEAILITIFIARMGDEKVQLAAFGGLVYPLVTLLESPLYMLLSASNTLCDSQDSFQRVRKYSLWISFACSCFQAIVVIPFVFNFVVYDLIHVPEEIGEAAFLPLCILVPSSAFVGMRRFYQGVLVRLGHSKSVGRGTFYRILLMTGLLSLLFSTDISGGAAGATACMGGIAAEALYARFLALKLLNELPPTTEHPQTLSRFSEFYLPLALTSILALLAMPIASSALSRAPLSNESLMIWPITWQLVLAINSGASALPEITVSYLARGMPLRELVRFRNRVALGTLAVMVVLLSSGMSQLWFQAIGKLEGSYLQLAEICLCLSALFPVIRCFQHFSVGKLLYARKTRPITQGIGVYLATQAGILILGVHLAERLSLPGAYLAAFSVTVAVATQAVWLGKASRELGI